MNINQVEYFLQIFQTLGLSVSEERGMVKELKQSLEELTQIQKRQEARTKSPSFVWSIEEANKIAAETRELIDRVLQLQGALWANIDRRTLDALTIVAQTKIPNSQDLVDLFTGDPLPF
jgi:hypothetical protein